MEYNALSRALRSKAKAEEDRTGNHVRYYTEIAGVRRLVTVISHGTRGQISKTLLGKISRQMRLSTRQMQQFVDYTLSRDEWLNLWENALLRG